MDEIFQKVDNDIVIQFGISVGVVILVFLLRNTARRLVLSHIRKNNLDEARKFLINKFINVSALMITFSLIAVVWDVTFEGVAVYFTSFFAVAGVALFAQWSILSNITASVVLFFNYPFGIGSTIMIKDGDNSISGIVTNISFFNIHIKTKEGENMIYPNTLALQKPIQIIKA